MELTQEQNAWSREVAKVFNCSDTKKVQRLHDDVLCIACDLKPMLLLDYLKPDASCLQKLLNSVPIRAPLESQWTILRYNEEVFLGSLPQIRHRLLNDVNISTMVDVTTTDPLIMADVMTTSTCKELCKWLEKATLPIQGHHEERCMVMEAPTGLILNPCTVYGWLLGYPVVYWFDVEQGYQLDMVELVRNVITATNELPSIPPATQLLWQNVSTELNSTQL